MEHGRSLSSFEDILAERRKEYSNFIWTSRTLKPKVSREICPRPTPEELKTNVLQSPKIQNLIQQISTEKGLPPKVVERQVLLILDEIGFNKSLKIIRWCGLFLTKVCCKVCNGIFVNTDSINKLKSSMGQTPVIFVPSHRSYADFILFSYILFTYDIEIPAIAAGMDFHGMKGMGTMLRNTGAFFMRRSYNDDALYWDTFKEYVQDIVKHGDSGIEFFIEGTRSRSCKSLPPKFGLLTMILSPFITSEIADLHFVPVNISYDRVMEERLFAFELLGIPKPKESTSGFFKSLNIIKECFGNIYVDFGEPISAKSYLQIDRSKHAIKPLHMQSLTTEERGRISKFAEHIVHSQQKLSTITTFNLIAIILTNNLCDRKNIMRLDDLVRQVIWLKSVVELFGALTDIRKVRRGIEMALEVHGNLVHMDEQQNITLVENAVVLGQFNPTKLKGHGLTEDTMTVAVPFVMLQLYVNPVMHYLINPAILVVVVDFVETSFTGDLLKSEYLYLRHLFRYEFALFDELQDIEFDSAIQHLLRLEALSNTDGIYSPGKNTRVYNLLKNMLLPFLYSYYTLCIVLTEFNFGPFAEKTLLAATQENLESVILNDKHYIHPYTLSLDTLGNCIQSLIKYGILTKQKIDGTSMFELNIGPLNEMISKLEKFIPDGKKYAETLLSAKLKHKL